MAVNLKEQYQMFIGGEWKGASDNGTIDVKNPAMGEYLTKIANGTESDVDDAVSAARKILIWDML